MKKCFSCSLIVAVALIVLLGVSTQSYAQTIFFFDNFETGIIDPTKWSSIVSNPQSGIAQDNSNLGSTGNWSAQQTYLAGWTDAGGVSWMNIGKAQIPSHALVEYDFKLSSNFHFPLGQKMWRTMNNMNTGAVPANSDVTLNVSMLQHGRSMQVNIQSYSPTFGNVETTLEPKFSLMSVNVWHRLGLRLKKNTFSGSTPNSDGEVELFLDGVSIGLLRGRRLTAIQSKWYRDYWGGPGNYTSSLDNNPIPANQWIRVDNFKITDLTVQPSAPPTAPTQLIVQ